MGFFSKTPYVVSDGNIVYAKDINNPLAAIETSFDSVAEGIQKGMLTYAADTGVANAYSCSLNPPVTEYIDGQEVCLKPSNTNTGNATLSLNGLSAVPILRIGLAELEDGDLPANYYVHLKYSNGAFQIVSNIGTPDAQAQLSAVASAASAEESQSAYLALIAETALLYKKSNILGTVSQSAGTPTGAIIESGSNSNGTYTKYADGTMFCFKTIGSLGPINSAYGALFSSGIFQTGDWPHAFAATPRRTATSYSGSNVISSVEGASAPSTTSPGSMSLVRASSSALTNFFIDIIGVGRWF